MEKKIQSLQENKNLIESEKKTEGGEGSLDIN